MLYLCSMLEKIVKTFGNRVLQILLLVSVLPTIVILIVAALPLWLFTPIDPSKSISNGIGLIDDLIDYLDERVKRIWNK